MPSNRPDATRRRRLLVVDDDEIDRRCTVQALSNTVPDVDIIEAVDGQHGLERIASDAPDLVLLDLNMPGIDGFEVLRTVKADETCRRIPVVVFSTSDNPNDIARCLDLHANAYLCKPDSVAGYSRLADSIHAFWMTSAQPAGLSLRQTKDLVQRARKTAATTAAPGVRRG